MSKQTFVSIIVPVYNTEKYLRRCIDSILTQTYQNFELLLIDDGSKDSSGAICDEYARNDERIRVIHRANSGVSVTRNIGIQEAKGDYISFVDSDDYIAVNMIETLVVRANKYYSDIVMCKYFIEKTGKTSCVSMDYDEVYDGADRVKNGLLYLYYTDYHSGLYSLWNKLIKKSVYSTNNILFDSSLKRGEDAWFIFQCLKHCKRVDFIPEAYYYYYQNESSVMHTLYDDQYEKWVDMRRRLIAENKQLGFDIDYDLFYKDFLYKTIMYCRSLVQNNRLDEEKRIISDEFLIRASKHSKKLPLHLIFFTKCISMGMRCIATAGLKLWCKAKK